MVSTASSSTNAEGAPREGQGTPDAVSSYENGRIRELEQRLDKQAVRRDGWTLFIFTFSAVALVASAFAVDLGFRAIHESKRNVHARIASTQNAASTTPRIVLTEFNVGLSTTTFAPGKHAVVIANGGNVQHELLVFRSDMAPSAFPVDATGDIIEDGPGITILSDGPNIDPGKSQNRTIDLAKPGRYVFLCNLPGHFKSGMFAEVTVG